MVTQDLSRVQLTLGAWFHVGDYTFPLSFMVDRLSLPIVGVTVILVGLVGAFSVSYLHRDPGFLRFFLLLHLFAFGALLVFCADSLDLLIGGWEIVGITSVLLISFFQYRPEPVRNALRVFGTYRIADLFMLVAVFLAHHEFHTASWNGLFTGEWPSHVTQLTGTGASIIAVLLVFAASGKAAQGPFCGWLARAMEGPTPSSAIFYGAISVHAGPYLLLRIEPLIRTSAIATGLVIFIGITTAMLSTMIHRTCADAKTSLAYASQTQLGIIFVEIGLGWTTLALIHIIGHAAVRTMQILRTPSMLRDHHRIHAAAGGQLDPTPASPHGSPALMAAYGKCASSAERPTRSAAASGWSAAATAAARAAAATAALELLPLPRSVRAIVTRGPPARAAHVTTVALPPGVVKRRCSQL
jgi:NADH:ubiquinone oxidoreductase subunit 5 (subunit L)/multisubunit Na+/H+ antiporter MnhA subunit